MIDEWIVETFQYILCKLLQFLFRKIQCLHQFIKHHFMNILADYLMLASITHDIHTRQVCYRRKNRVRTIEQSYFAFVIRSFRRNKQYIQPCLISREFFCHFCGASITHRWKISACTTRLSSYCIFSLIAAISLRGNPGTIRSTNVAYTRKLPQTKS